MTENLERAWINDHQSTLTVSPRGDQVRVKVRHPDWPAAIHTMTPTQAREVAEHLTLCADAAETPTTKEAPVYPAPMQTAAPYPADSGVYAAALIRAYPRLRLGSIVEDRTMDGATVPVYHDVHFFAHDGTYAYDADGAHPMPWTGGDSAQTMDLEHDLADFGEDVPALDTVFDGLGYEVLRVIRDDLAACLDHARQSGITRLIETLAPAPQG